MRWLLAILQRVWGVHPHVISGLVGEACQPQSGRSVAHSGHLLVRIQESILAGVTTRLVQDISLYRPLLRIGCIAAGRPIEKHIRITLDPIVKDGR
jgi:hypothetical protein